MRKNYSIAEALKILDLGRDQLFYWMKTKRLIKMEVEGKGRGARSRLSGKNIFELAIIKELSDIGVELNTIDQVLNGQNAYRIKSTAGEIALKRGERYVDYVFSIYEKEKIDDSYEELREFLLLLYKNEENEFEYELIVQNPVGRDHLRYLLTSHAVIVVDLYELIWKLDRKIGGEV